MLVRFDQSNAYFIDVRGHKSWSDQSLIQLIHNNWPHTIAAFRFPSHTRLVYQATNSQVSDLRKAKINSPVGVTDGTLYGSIGGGVACNNVSGEVVSLMLNAQRKITEWQKAVHSNMESIVSDALSKGVVFSESHEIKLDFEGACAYAVEKNNLFYLELGSL